MPSQFKSIDSLGTYEDYIIDLASRLNDIRNIARNNQEKAKKTSKVYYDRKSNSIPFQVGQNRKNTNVAGIEKIQMSQESKKIQMSQESKKIQMSQESKKYKCRRNRKNTNVAGIEENTNVAEIEENTNVAGIEENTNVAEIEENTNVAKIE
ncbi:hypothetical protein PV328_010342 [Microctonus aethiopoides]|uniref:Uncharacterized protein n=1 Tax=Microctonus aethiopoides TaxID=144406 RepID=A0AA39FHJ0_9HYME|nr:hypothetical protein PV328_010342 [Microctonus aethiopoides]